MLATKLKVTAENLQELNSLLETKTPAEIVRWAFEIAERPIVTTNFRPYEGSILHACVTENPAINVIWCDTGYNTPNTYRCAEELIDMLQLNVDLFVPKQTVAHRDLVMGIPGVDDPKHAEFTRQVKLEPFARAMAKHQPDVWFTNLRKGQTALRNSLNILSLSSDGVLKVSPFYHYSDAELDKYMEEHHLPNETKYFDPTKALANRECGLHT